MSRHTVFVYGTLKRGQPNEYFMKQRHSAGFLWTAVTKETYPLIISSRQWNLPMLLDVPGQGNHVKGELYNVNDADLAKIDEFEGHPEFYKRKEIEVNILEDGNKTVKCWAYFVAQHTEEDLNSQRLDTYDSNGDHGLQYDVSENEDHPGVSSTSSPS